ncbi:MAG: cadherin domain-containing protein [Pirellulales bacterium]
MFKKFRKPTPDYAQLEDRVLLSATPLSAPPAANSPELTPSDAVTFAATPATGTSSTNGNAQSSGTDDTFSAIATQTPQPDASPSIAEDGGFLYESSSVDHLQAARTDNSSNSDYDYAQLVAELLTADAETPPLALQAIDNDKDSWGIEHNWSDADALDFNIDRMRREIAFVDTSVQDYTTLVAGILANNDGTRDIEIVLLDEASDGTTQIRDTLATRQDIDAIHLVTHGTSNSLRLGSTRLDLANLDEHADVIREWGHALTANGDILVYGCDLASTEDGQHLLGAISELAQADVAGSDDATGSASMSADWTLEYLVGEIESQVAMNEVEGESWTGLLATLTVTNTNDSGAGSLRAAMLAAVNGDVITFNIAGVGPHTINVASELPTITQSITIDGWTEPDYSSLTAIPAIVVNGNATNNTNGFRITASNVTIRGLTINRFDAAGIYIESGSNNVIQGNFIGTDATGNALAETLGAMSDGIRIQSANNVIGGVTAQTRNIIAGSDEGIRLHDATATGNIIRGNLLGVSRDQTTTLGFDDDGIDIGSSAAANTIGGTGVNEGNVIAGAQDAGIETRNNSGAGNVFLRNSIYLNGGIAIDVNANGSSGNFPVLTSASSGGGITTIGGTLSGAANTTYRVEFFSSGPTFADSHGEARVYLGHADITTNAAGSGVINTSLNAPVNHGDFVSAAMTPVGGETSELSANRAVTGLTTEVVVDTRRDVADAPGFGTTLTLATLLSNRGADGVISLREAIDAANRTAGLNTIRFNLPGGAQQTINLVSALPSITEAVVIDATSDTDFAGSPVIELNGASAGSGVAGLRLASTVNGGSIRGFVINRFSTNGILLDGADNVVIAGNYIGTDFTGQLDRGNTEDGIQLQAGATGNTIGGLTASDRNIISGNNNAGLAIDDTATADNLIIGNYVGLAADGITAIGNTHDGIHLVGATNNTIGGITTSARNVIASNAIHGIGIDGASGTKVLGNYIGVAANGSSVRGNLGDGIRLTNSVTGTVIGGTTTQAANVIANNLGDGILVNTAAGTAATILGNSIYANGEQAIDLGADNGLTYNDVLDADSGANNLLNFPELQTATSVGDDVVVTGKMRGAAATTYRVEIYRSPFGTGDSSGYGEARELLGTASVTTNSSGNATFSVTLPNKTLLSGDLVTATATVDLGSGNYGATSEFGGNILAHRPNMVLSGSYTGNGLDNRVISGLGFRPEAIIVIPGNSTQSGVLRTSTMAGDAAKRMTGSSGLVANLIQSLDGDGFTIGNDNAVNSSGITYHWMAFGAGDHIDLGAYNGNGSSQTITGVGFQAELTIFASTGSGLARFHSSLAPPDTFAFDDSSPGSNGVTSYNSDGFSVSSGAGVNESGQTIHYIAFNADANYFRQATYVGNNSDNRSINGVGFQPELMWVRQLNSTNNVAFKTTSTGPNTDNTIFPDSNTNAANNIQSLHSEGFIIGSDDRVNKSSSDFGYFAFKQIASPLIVDTTSDIVDGSTSSASELLANKGADGRISLREAILAANNTAGEDHIYFNIVDALVGGAHTINLTSALPTITDKVLLDASTDFDFAGTPVVVLNGAAAGAGAAGITLGDAADGSVIRGLVIRSFQDGIVGDFHSNNHLIVGNYLGVDVTGAIDQGNSRAGILLRGEGSTIGGNTSSERNLISGNDGYGIYLDGGADNNVIIGNWIGVNSTGNVALGNTFNGVFLGGNVGNRVGGTGVGEGNVIGGSGDIAVRIEAGEGHTIQGNSIGVGANGVSSVGNLVGVSVRFGSTDILIGGTSGAAANRIWNNSHGILVEDSTTSSVAILGNSIANHVQLGIDLGADGVSSNDVDDADSGPNDLQNSPELISVFSSGGQTFIRGSIDSAANQSYRVEFFSSPVGDISGHGEGLTFLGAIVAATDATGRAYFSTTLNGLTLNVGEIVTATATQALLGGEFGATSEFAENVTASDNAPPIIDIIDNLLGHWRFENSPVDSSGNNYDGEFRNGAASNSASVRVGVEAVSLDGVNDFVDLSSHASTLGTLSSGTIAGWIKTSSSGVRVIFDFADASDPSSHAQLGISSGNLFFEVIENGVSQLNVQTIGQTLNDNQWHHVAVTVGSNGNQLYVDGELLGVGSVVYTSGDPSTTTFVAGVTAVDSITIGAGVSSSGLTNAWNGQLDEIRLYGHALAAFEIDALALPALNLGLTVSAGASGAINSNSLAVADADTAPSALVYTLQSLPSHGTLRRNGVALTTGGVFSQQDINNNIITYLHSGTETASDNFQFAVVDGDGGTLGPLVFEITILPVNDASPIIESNGGGATAALNVFENNTAVTTVVATDADLPAQTLTYSITGGADAAKFSIVGSSGVLTFAAAPNFESPTDANGDDIYEVVVQASDGTLTDTQTLSVTVTAVNDNPPIITSNGGGATAALNVAENNTAVTTVVAADADLPAQTLTYSITGGADAAKFALVGSTGELTFAAAPNFESPTDANGDNIYEVVVQASDGTLTDTQTLSVTVTAVNDNPPIITSNGGGATAALNVAENNTAVTTVVAADADLPTQTLTYSITGGADAAKFVIVGSTGELTFAAAPNFESPTDANGDNIYEVVVQAFDGTLTDTQTLSVTVTAVNDNPPVITSNGSGATGALNVAENNTAVTTVVAADADLPAQTLTYSITGGADAAKFVIVGSSGVLTFAAAPNFESPTDANGDNIYEVIVQASDGTLTDTQTLSVTVTAVNDNPPVITSNGGGATAAMNVAEDSTAVTTIVATDADLPAQTLTYSITGGADAAKFAIIGSTGELTFAAAPNFESPTDANGDNIYEVVVQASDGTLTDTQTLSVTVTAVNDSPPVITSNGGGATGALNVAENNTAVTTVVAADADLPTQTLTYSITGGADAAKFVIVGSTGELTFAAAPNFESPTDANGDNIYEVVVQASDGTLTDTQTLSVTVTAVNDNSPVITSNGGGATGALSVLENSTAVTTVVAADADLPTQTLTYSITGGADAARFSIGGSSGVLTFATAPNFDSPTDTNSDNIYQVIVRVSDGSLSTTQTLSVSVANVNESPVGADGNVTALEDSDYVFTVSNFGFSDPLDSPQNTLNAVRIVTLPAIGTLTNNGLAVTSGQIISVADITAGRLVYRAPNNANGVAFTSLTFQVQDNGGTANGGIDWDQTPNTLTINVTAINDPPTSTAPTTAAVTAGTSLVFSSSTGNALTVSDVDASTVRVSLTASEGTLSLSTIAGLTFTTGDGVGDSAMVFTGTLTAINTALNGLTFANAINHSGSDTITFTVNDLGSTGVGGPLQASKTISVTITSPAVPIIGDTFLKGDYLQVGIGTDGALGSDGQAPSGYVSAGQQLGVEVDPERDGWATYDGDFILPGTPEETWGVRVGGSTYSNSNVQSAQISGALTNYTTSSSVESVDWIGAVGGLNIDTTYQVGKGNLYIDVAVSLTNATAATMSNVYYYRNVDPDNNVLQGVSDGYKTTNTIISQGNDGSGVAFVKAMQSDGSYLGLMGFGDNARVTYGGFSNRDVQAIYNGSSTLLQSGSRTADEAVSLAFKVNSLAAGETTTLHFRYYFGAAVEPTVDLDPNDSGTAIGSNFNAIFTEGGGSVAITDTDATIFDSDSSNLKGMTIRITNLLDVGSESLTATTTGAITANFSGDTLTLSGVDSVANYRQVLRSIRYDNSSLDPDTSTRVITFQASDGVHSSNVASALVTINTTNNAPTITSPATLTVAENTTSLLTVTSSDPDGAARVYSITGGADASKFTINSALGTLSFLSAPNFESPADVGGDNVYQVQVTANDQRGGVAVQTITISVTDVDEFDLTPLVDTALAANNVTEDAVVGSTVGITAYSVDGDATNNTVVYSLDDDSNGQFTIHSQTGVVTVAGLIDREAGATRTITIRATSADHSTVTQAYLITVNDVDEFDLTPLVDTALAANNVTENAAVGSTVGITAYSVDGDATNNSVVYSLDDDSNGQFAIHSQTGVVTVAGLIDREAGATRTVTIRATSADHSTVTQAYLITVNDVDEFDLTPLVDAALAANNVTENAVVGSTVGITAYSVDGDATNNSVVYSLDDDSNGQFAIHSQTGVVTVAGLIDREAGATRTITIRATSADHSTVTQAYLITVNDVDEFDLTPLVDTALAANNVTENAAVGSTVGITAYSVDGDATNNSVVYSLDDDSNGQFAIDSQTGVVTVAGLIDREAGATRTITIRATSADHSTVTQSYLITVNDVDEFDLTPLVDTALAANNVTENAVVGTTIGITAYSVDDDATNNTVVYSLDDDSNGQFAIDSQTGVVTVAGLIDREAGATRTVTIRATSADNSTVTQSYLITVNDVDEFDLTPLVDTALAANNVTENAVVGSTVGITAYSVDGDATNNSVVYSLDDDSNGQFAIDSQTGVVTVAGLIDREAGATRTITIRATSADHSTVTQSYLITVNDVDEFDLTPLVDTALAANNVTENAVVGSTVGITAYSVDDDATNNSVVYSLDDDSNGQFAIDSQTGVVTVAGLIDREAGATRTVTIRATSADNSTVTQSYLITVNDVDEFDLTPLVDTALAANNVTENAVVGSTVGITAYSVDDDATNNSVVYSLDDDSNGQFAIDSQTGVVTVAGLIDREAGATRTVTIRATSADNSTVTQSYLITVNDVDEFDLTPLVDTALAANNVTENAVVGTTIGITAYTVDGDATNNSVVYSLDDDSNGQFAIDSQTGVVTVAGLIDREAGATRTVTIRATSADNSTVTQSYLITVNDVDELDLTPLVDTALAANNVTENAVVGTTIGITAYTVDGDATNNTVVYSLDDDSNGQFAIDSQTGVVTVAGLIDREAGATRTITIRATSADHSTVTQSYLITVNDVNEFDLTPLVDAALAANNVTENAVVGSTVGITAYSVDDDATNNSVVYSLDDDSNGQFAIDSQTGVVTVAGLIDREAGATRTVTIRATSADNSTVTQSYLITVNDVDEFDLTPLVDTALAANNVTENAVVGSTVGITAYSVDDDATNNSVVYSLDDDSNGQFAIDSQTGVVTVAGLIDREAGATRTITIRATSADNSTVTQAYLITVNDVNEFDLTPLVDAALAANNVTENAVVGTTIGITAYTVDGDATNNTVVYSLDDDSNGQFAIDSQTGVVTVAGLIDREAGATRTITIRATSADNSTVTQAYLITVNDVDEFDLTPLVDTALAANNVTENAVVGTTIGITAYTVDSDATNNTVVYSLDNDSNGQFAIHSQTGVVTVAGNIDREAGPTRSITIRATSADHSTVTQAYLITVNDVDEFDLTPIIDLDLEIDRVTENSPAGTVVHVIAYSFDADATDNTIAYSLDDDAGGRFTVDSHAGLVTVADGSLLNFELDTSHTITVRAESDDGSTITREIAIVVEDINENVVIGINTGATLLEGGAHTLSPSELQESDPDDSGPDVIFTVISTVSHGRLTLLGTELLTGGTFTQEDIDSGRISYEHNGGETTADGFSFSVMDGGEAGTIPITDEFHFSITPVNDAPIAVGERFVVDSDSLIVLNQPGLLANDSDAELTPLQAILATSPASGTLIFNSDGSLQYRPDPNFDGYVSFSYRVDDGQASSSVVWVTIEVNNVYGPGGGSNGGPGPTPVDKETPPPTPLLGPAPPRPAASTSFARLHPEYVPTPERQESQTRRTEAVIINDDPTILESRPIEFTAAFERYREQAPLWSREWSVADTASTLEVATLLNPQLFWERLTDFERELTEETQVVELTVGTVALASFAFTAGYIFWTIKGGSLLISVMSQFPAWRYVDPLPIFDASPNSLGYGGEFDDEEGELVP